VSTQCRYDGRQIHVCYKPFTCIVLLASPLHCMDLQFTTPRILVIIIVVICVAVAVYKWQHSNVSHLNNSLRLLCTVSLYHQHTHTHTGLTAILLGEPVASLCLQLYFFHICASLLDRPKHFFATIHYSTLNQWNLSENLCNPSCQLPNGNTCTYYT